jgi:hypothetical protein
MHRRARMFGRASGCQAIGPYVCIKRPWRPAGATCALPGARHQWPLRRPMPRSADRIGSTSASASPLPYRAAGRGITDEVVASRHGRLEEARGRPAAYHRRRHLAAAQPTCAHAWKWPDDGKLSGRTTTTSVRTRILSSGSAGARYGRGLTASTDDRIFGPTRRSLRPIHGRHASPCAGEHFSHTCQTVGAASNLSGSDSRANRMSRRDESVGARSRTGPISGIDLLERGARGVRSAAGGHRSHAGRNHGPRHAGYTPAARRSMTSLKTSGPHPGHRRGPASGEDGPITGRARTSQAAASRTFHTRGSSG